MPEKQIVEEINRFISYGGLGALGGVALYLNGVRKGKTFKIGMFAVNVILAGIVGYFAGQVIPDSVTIKNSLVGVSGFLAYPILDLLEDKGFSLLIERVIGKK